MKLKKFNRQIYNVLSSNIKGEIFIINKMGQFQFIKTRFKGLTVDYLYSENNEKFIEFLEELWYQVNIVDKHNIQRIIRELTKN